MNKAPRNDAQRTAARQLMIQHWADPTFRAKMKQVNKAQGHYSGAAHPRWRGGTFKSLNGYVFVLYQGRYVQRSHVVWDTAHPDDPVTQSESIHHLNRIKDDDRIENLQKLAKHVHSSLHRQGPLPPEWRAHLAESLRRAATTRIIKVKSCGKSHSWCRVCSPTTAAKIGAANQKPRRKPAHYDRSGARGTRKSLLYRLELIERERETWPRSPDGDLAPHFWQMMLRTIIAYEGDKAPQKTQSLYCWYFRQLQRKR